jgi:hypothetical protein
MTNPATDATPARSPDDLLAPADVFAQYNIAIGTLAYWRSAGSGPPYIRLAPRVIRYRRGVLEAWIAAREVQPNAAEIDVPTLRAVAALAQKQADRDRERQLDEASRLARAEPSDP